MPVSETQFNIPLNTTTSLKLSLISGKFGWMAEKLHGSATYLKTVTSAGNTKFKVDTITLHLLFRVKQKKKKSLNFQSNFLLYNINSVITIELEKFCFSVLPSRGKTKAAC